MAGRQKHVPFLKASWWFRVHSKYGWFFPTEKCLFPRGQAQGPMQWNACFVQDNFQRLDRLGGCERIYTGFHSSEMTQNSEGWCFSHPQLFSWQFYIFYSWCWLIENLIQYLEAILLPNCPPALELMEAKGGRRKGPESHLLALWKDREKQTKCKGKRWGLDAGDAVCLSQHVDKIFAKIKSRRYWSWALLEEAF